VSGAGEGRSGRRSHLTLTPRARALERDRGRWQGRPEGVLIPDTGTSPFPCRPHPRSYLMTCFAIVCSCMFDVPS